MNIRIDPHLVDALEAIRDAEGISVGPHIVAILKAHRDRASRTAWEDLLFGNRSGIRFARPTCCRTSCSRLPSVRGLAGSMASVQAHSLVAAE